MLRIAPRLAFRCGQACLQARKIESSSAASVKRQSAKAALDRAEAHRAGVVVEDVDAAVGVDRAVHPALRPILVGHVQVRRAALGEDVAADDGRALGREARLRRRPWPRAVPLISATLPARRPLKCRPSAPPRT